MECLGLYNKPKAEVHPGHKLTGPKEREEEPAHNKVLHIPCICESMFIM